jgi:hypothetical protein
MVLFWKVPTAGFYDNYEIRMSTDNTLDIFNLDSLTENQRQKIYVLELNSETYEEKLSDPSGEMNIMLPVDGTKTYKIGMTTSFQTPTRKLPTNVNDCVWICTPVTPSETNKNHTCNVMSSDCQLLPMD